MLTPFAVVRGTTAMFVALVRNEDKSVSVVWKHSRTPFAFDPDNDVVVSEGMVTTAVTRDGSARITGGSVSIADLDLQTYRFAGIGAEALVYGHPNLSTFVEKESLIDAIYASAEVTREAVAA